MVFGMLTFHSVKVHGTLARFGVASVMLALLREHGGKSGKELDAEARAAAEAKAVLTPAESEH